MVVPMNKTRKGGCGGARGCLTALLGVYCIQIALIIHSQLVPDLDKSHDGKRYQVWLELFPVYDFFPIMGLLHQWHRETVILTVTDREGREVIRKRFDVLGDVVSEYPEIK